MFSMMDGCTHGMDADWCYLCRIERSGADPRVAWGLGSSAPEEGTLDGDCPHDPRPSELPQIIV